VQSSAGGVPPVFAEVTRRRLPHVGLDEALIQSGGLINFSSFCQ
jgi:hypothetical protein